MHAYECKRGRRGGRARINGRKARWVKNEKADRIAKDVLSFTASCSDIWKEMEMPTGW